MPDIVPPSTTSHVREKGAWIGAIATLLAAVIGAWATLHARAQVSEVKHEQKSTLEEVARLREEVTQRDKVISDLERRLKGTTTAVDDVSDEDAIYDHAPRAQGQEQGFEIKLYACRRNSAAVNCYFDVKNLRADRKFQIAGYPGDNRYSRGYDDHGQLHTAEVPEISGSENGDVVTIPEGVTLRATLTFKSVTTSRKTFSDLAFVFFYEYETYAVHFRNVAIE